MGVVVSFDHVAWIARYPEFSEIDPTLAQAYFDEATIYHRNDGGGPVTTASVQSMLLNMVTAHIAARHSPPQGQTQPSPLVGRINNASEGSVSVQVQNEYPPGTAQWWQQTKYGSDYWNATGLFRTARYVPGPRRTFGPVPWGRFR